MAVCAMALPAMSVAASRPRRAMRWKRRDMMKKLLGWMQAKNEG
jgi:hypothetical protein